MTAATLPGDLRKHPWFTRKDPSGAATCEVDVAIPGVMRWTRRVLNCGSPRRHSRPWVSCPYHVI